MPNNCDTIVISTAKKSPRLGATISAILSIILCKGKQNDKTLALDFTERKNENIEDFSLIMSANMNKEKN